MHASKIIWLPVRATAILIAASTASIHEPQNNARTAVGAGIETAVGPPSE